MDNTFQNNISLPSTTKPDQLTERFQSALKVVDDIVLKNYIQRLHDFEIIPLDETTKAMNLSDNVRLFKITEMVYEKDEFSTYKFASVFNSLSTADCAVFIIVDSNGEKTDFYMGIRAFDSEMTPHLLGNILEKAMIGQFPGIKTKDYEDEHIRSLLDRKFDNISIVSCVANSKDNENRDNRAFVQGLEKLAFAMQGEKYTAIILANATAQQQLDEIRRGYEAIYTQLSPFARTQLSYSSNASLSFSNALSNTESSGTSHAVNTSHSSGTSDQTTDSTNESVSKAGIGSKVVGGLSAAVGILGAALAIPTGGTSLAVSGIVSGGLSILGSAIQKTKSTGSAHSTSHGNNEANTEGTSDSTNQTNARTNTETKGITQGSGQNMTMTLEDKTILNMLERIDLQLKRLQEFESLGMWECSAYFMSDKPYAAEIAASTYKALMRGENSGVEVCAINSWRNYEKENKVQLLTEYALNFIHPVFSYPSSEGEIQVTPCSLVSGNELAIHMGLPRKSVCGFPVIEHADFGKEVVSYTHESSQANINLGVIFNMGSETPNHVLLDRNSLAMHTFVTGSTGSGKSNTVYEILRQLEAVGISFLVIEPAKGEYKNIFGNQSGVRVFGTNPEYADILRINPFKFPKGIHVLEHVDRLIEIFNVCWPMYAAMPAVLKEAVLQAYEVCGWDLQDSTNTYDDNLFPTFRDLLTELVDVIDNSAYDKEVKSNYKGSLETRVKSLANGLNGQLFSTDEIDNQTLFDTNVIVDLSRIGSLETKALIMGILVMRLNEHRMTLPTGMNSPLHHVTVLEEAHNILKRTSSEFNAEGSNMTGKSVEMLSNAIAEMRTFGEGFIIADQSPSAVDISAIRNTNTKIIMRLPDETDRRLAGKSAALKDEQLDEIAKLPKGVAVVYQNDWLEPVLCKVKKYSGTESIYSYEPSSMSKIGKDDLFEGELIKLLLKGRISEEIEVDIDDLDAKLPFVNLSTKNRIGIKSIIEEFRRTHKLTIWEDKHFGLLSRIVCELLGVSNRVERFIQEAGTFPELNKKLNHLIDTKLRDVPESIKLSIGQCLMKNYSTDNEDNLRIYAVWRNDVVNRGGLS